MSRVYFAYYDYFFFKNYYLKFFLSLYIFMNRLQDKMDIQMNHI